MILDVIGIDPGPVTGIVRLSLDRADQPGRKLINADALQVTYGLVAATLDMLYREGPGYPAVAVERFVVGHRAARSSTAAAGEVTRELIGVVADWANRKAMSLHDRSAAEVKPWASDARLRTAGLMDAVKDMRHARDAARHALFCAVRCYGMRDPFSLKPERGYPGGAQ